ncbi:MAG: hypothetical protein K0S74_388 [Chlamydiales bacterium]|jgi:predicted hotdog family 3-hydroxylacyl-ACP dehydratase|nr:hypothetical protein [Chlamydiales bacterium]
MNSNPIHNRVSDLLPHAPPMVLVDKLIEYREDFVHTTVTIRKDSVFYENGQVPSYVGLEYMAQTIGVWHGLSARRTNQSVKIGFLLGTRKLILEEPYFQLGDELHIFAEFKCMIDHMASFECCINIRDKCIAKASVNVFEGGNELFKLTK